MTDAAYDLGPWSDFGVAAAGASAALAGLLIVAVSINVREIVADATLPRRAGGALVMLTAPLLTALLLLIPVRSEDVVATALLVLGIVGGVMLAVLNRPGALGPNRSRPEWIFGSLVPATLVAIPTALAGIGLMTSSLGGLYWLPVAVLAAFVGGLAQAWVLLIEILR